MAAAVVRAAEVVASFALNTPAEERLAGVTRHAAKMVAFGALAAYAADFLGRFGQGFGGRDGRFGGGGGGALGPCRCFGRCLGGGAALCGGKKEEGQMGAFSETDDISVIQIIYLCIQHPHSTYIVSFQLRSI